ncbi:choice-of-anchor P family protein [Microtetraspora niveoalba]|uniref:choice-of-anchor P family protein n=1 Tax=Microtetraspora niveoalba TaxID=46175 RepID=UPI000A79B509|nr:choice-of-anchor P family protein [Microtetraspora niveoalba]
MNESQALGRGSRAMKRALAGTAALALATALAAVGQSGIATAEAASPGEPKDPKVVFTEDFENDQGATPILVTDYTGAAPIGQTYDADPAWLTGCNGWITSLQQPGTGPAGAGCGNWWTSAQQMAGALGQWAGGDKAKNHAVTAYTSGNPGANKTQLETRKPVDVGAAGRFLTFSVDVAEVNCYAEHAKLGFYLLDGDKAVPTFTTPIDPCSNPGGTVNGVPVGTYTSNGPVLFDGSTLGLRLVNFQGSGYGNDAAFDNVRVLDVTPQLDVAFDPGQVEVGGTSTMTLRVTNTSELAVKKGWSFTERLPDGLTLTGAPPVTDCADATVTAVSGGGKIGVTGTLAAGAKSCGVTVKVTSARAATYTVCAEDVVEHAGVNLPECARVRFVPPVLVFDAHAHGGRVTAPLIDIAPLAPSDLSCREAAGDDRHKLLSAGLGQLGSLGVIDTRATGAVDPDGRRTATASATTSKLSLLAGLVTADEITAFARARGDDAGRVTADGKVDITNLKVNGVKITDLKTDLTIDVPLVAKVVINEQVRTGGGGGIKVNAIHIRTLAGVDIIVGHARASLIRPGQACPA